MTNIRQLVQERNINRSEIITSETRELVADIEATTADESVDPKLTALVGHLISQTARPEVRQRYNRYASTETELQPYPLDADGYATAFDPLHEETALFEIWQRTGVAVAKNVVAAAACEQAVTKIHHTLGRLGADSCSIASVGGGEELPSDAHGTPILSRGFFEVYHDDSLAQLRQAVRLYLHHTIIWGRADLWTTFDRFGVKIPGHETAAALPLHVDQNPQVDAGFKTTQGVLALEDCPPERGTLVVVPGSKQHFADYASMARNKGEYVELDTGQSIARKFAAYAQPLPLKKGHIASWDSRTTHANTPNISDQARFVALISAGPNREDDTTAILAREDAFATGLGSNVRNALMHASMRPRYTNESALQALRQPERLTILGALLYGQVRYASIS